MTRPTPTPADVLGRRARAFRRAMAAMRVLVAAADPRTDGDPGLARNWGNEESQAVIRRAWERWYRYEKTVDAAYRDALHREHEAEGRVGAYLWCPGCGRAGAGGKATAG